MMLIKIFFLLKNDDTMRVVCNVFLKDISVIFIKNLNIPSRIGRI